MPTRTGTPTPTGIASPFRLIEMHQGPWGPITQSPVLELDRFEVRVSCPQITARLSYEPQPGYAAELPVGRWGSVERSLDGVPGHKDAGPGLRRFAFVDAPVHGAVHQIVDVAQIIPDYCVVHVHEDAAELNVLLPGGDPLTFDMVVDVPFVGHPPLVAWIPPNTGHSAMATAGTGFFFVLRVPLV